MSELGVIECKSISHKGAELVKGSPDFGHVVQLQSYFWLTGLKWGKILYWDKTVYGLPAIIEHFVEKDDATIDRIKELIRSFRDGLRTGKVPSRICSSPDCKRAEGCALVKPCFDPVPVETSSAEAF